MGSFLILPHRHHLLPLAWRLRSEGHIVEVMPRSDRYERAWDGLFEKTISGGTKRSKTQLASVVEGAAAGQFSILTDSPKWAETFATAQHLVGGQVDAPELGKTVEIGGWRSPGGSHLPHFTVREVGAWPGGLGAQVTAATVTQWLDSPEGPWAEGFQEALAETADYQGLWRKSVSLTPEGVVEYGPTLRGWEVFQTQGLLCVVEELAKLLAGEPQDALEPYSATIAVSVPPWPVDETRSSPQPVGGLSKDQRQLVSWFDVRRTPEGLETAELDGLVGIVRAGGKTVQWAAQQALAVAGSFEMPDVQYRADVGATWNLVQLQLGRFGLV